jgi:tellurite resistance protein
MGGKRPPWERRCTVGEPQGIIRAVVAVLAADGKIGEEERGFLERLGKRLGVAEDGLERALDEVRKGEMTLEFPEDVAERKRLFDMMAEAARADGDVSPEEEKLLELVASRLGILDV